MPATAHARFGGSTAKAWLNCPAWGRLTEGLPDTAGPAAEEGDRWHALAERHARAWTPIEDLGQDPEIGEDDLELLAPYLEHIRAVQAENGGDLLIEERVDIHGRICFGTLDAGCFDPFTPLLDVMDLKTGAGVMVHPEENPQLGLYAAGLLRRLVGAKSKDWRAVVVRLHIVQPRRTDGRPAVTTWTTDGAWVEALWKEAGRMLKVQVDHSFDPRPRAGDWCTFCPRLSTCPAHLANLREAFPVEETPQELLDAQARDPAVLDGPTLARVAALAPHVTRWLKAVRQELLRRGGEPGMLKVVEGRSTRVWRDPSEAAAALQAAGIDPWKRTLVGITDGQKALLKAGVPKAEAEALLHKPPGKPTLAPWDDRRPAVDPSALASIDAFPADDEDNDL